MHWLSRVTIAIGVWTTAVSLQAKLPPEKLAQLPAPAGRPVDFRKDIQPILEASCIKCHARGKSKGGFVLDTRETALKDADSGPAIVLGNSAESHLVALISGLDPENVMPEKGSKLTPEQVGLIRAWIDQGLKWDPSVSFAKVPAKNLDPRPAALPPGGSGHPVDQFLEDYLRQKGVAMPPAVEDRVYARRVFLDVTGLLPAPEELEAFVRDPSADKRVRLVKRLLADNHRYAQHWLTYWNDLLRNDYRGTGYIDGGRKQISGWLYAALRDNKPYDRFVRELVNPTAESEGFTKGIVWRGAVNASMTPSMQAAQNISQIFMGVNLKCASCHDSFIDDWQLSDAYGLAGVYAEGALEMVLCDKPTGRTAPLKFLFPELGAIDGKASRPERLKTLSEIITSRQNGRLSRTIVNRLWARLMGRGLVEPLDVMQNEAWHPPLLDWLAEDLVAHEWDLKHTLGQILTSKAYQLPTVDSPEKDGKPLPNYVFQGPVLRRLTAEQFRDALGAITGVWQSRPEGGLQSELSAGLQTTPLPVGAFWIWNDNHAAHGVAPGAVYFRKLVTVPEGVTEATVWLSVDNEAKVFVNGSAVSFNAKPGVSELVRGDIRSLLKAGSNLIAVEATNTGADRSPAGLLVYLKIRAGDRVLDIGTDASWQTASGASDLWKLPDGGNNQWAASVVLGEPGMEPWNASKLIAAAVAELGGYAREFRASLVSADALALALGRPNREQINTVRQQTATTIQALELTNGGTLARLLKMGAEKLAAKTNDSRLLTRDIFQTALSRLPTDAELRLAVDLLGPSPKLDGVEDLLWSLAMLPEFQLIL